MGELTFWEKIIDYFTWRLPRQYKQFRCSHSKIITVFTAQVFLIEKWERCSGVAYCKDCGKDFGVSIPANEDERKSEHYLGY
jgi:transcription elongation factor Elf1